MLISELCSEYLRYIDVREVVTKTTLVTYRSNLGLFMSYVGDRKLEDLTVALIDGYAFHLAGSNRSVRTQKNKLATVRSFVSYLYTKDKHTLRPDQIELPKHDKDRERRGNFLEPHEEQLLLKAAKTYRDETMMHFLLWSGVRVSELVNMQIDDLYERSVFVFQGKGKKDRFTFVNESTRRRLDKYLSTRQDDSPYLFVSKDGSKLSRQIVTRIISEAGKRSGIKKVVTPHTLRHTFCTRMLMNGARAEDVRPMMGHTDIRTTLGYAHYSNMYLQGRYDKIAEVIESERAKVY